MTTILIDKKKQFQIQTVKSKLFNYKQTLITLLETRKKLSDNLDIINPNYDKIDKLNNDKNNIEINLKELKFNISKITNDITKLSKLITDLPSIRDNKHKNEEDILLQELNRITLQKYNDKLHYDESIETAHLDKLQLINDISIIQNSIQEQNNILSQLQLNAHSVRKDTLSLLHKKKQEKNNITLQQTQISKQSEFINIQITELENTINNLEKFKIILIDEKYTTSDIPSATPSDTITNYYNEFKIDKDISLNDKINIIDTNIINCKTRINKININLNKHKISSDIILTNIIDNYNKNNRIKVIAYKDNFKIEKEKYKQLQQILDTLIYQYDNFENKIFGEIKLELTKANNESEFDITRSNERFVIMKYRINFDFEIENNRIADEINILNINLKEMRKLFSIKNEELINLNIMIKNENLIGNDIAKLDDEINKYQAMIIQNETNIMLLSQ